jgi:hypothetical protein
VTTSHDHPDQPATSHGLTGAAHHAEAAARRADDYAQAARSVDCECQAPAGAPCGPAGDHLARYLHAHHAGALTRDSLKNVIAELDVIAPRALIQPPAERAASAGIATTAGHAISGQASTEMNAHRAGAPARSAPGGRGTPASYTRQEPELEAGS